MVRRPKPRKPRPSADKATKKTPIASVEPERTVTPIQSEYSPWWPMLRPDLEEKAIAAGQGDELKRLKDMRLELQAIKRRWAIPEDLKASIVHQSWSLATNPKIDPRVRVAAQKNILAMEAMNQKDENGPDAQIGIAITLQDGSQVQAFDLLDQMRRDFDYHGFDNRPFRPVAGSEDDYAE